MTRYVISGHFGADDRFRTPAADGTVVTALDLVNAAGKLRFGVNDALRQLASMEKVPSETGIDLLTLAAHVHAADTRLNRLQTSQDAWTREIGIVVPVSDVDLWEATRGVLERMLRFLTGDFWTVGFRPLPATGRPALAGRPRRRAARDFGSVSLFSGGLDSLGSGPVNLL